MCKFFFGIYKHFDCNLILMSFCRTTESTSLTVVKCYDITIVQLFIMYAAKVVVYRGFKFHINFMTRSAVNFDIRDTKIK